MVPWKTRRSAALALTLATATAAAAPNAPAGVAPQGAAPGPAARPHVPRIRFDASLDRGLVLEHDLLGVDAHFFLLTTAGFRLGDVRAAGFQIPAARPQLRGWALSKDLTYFIQAELAGLPSSTRLLDAQIAYKLFPLLQGTVGQFITPFSRQFLVPPFRTLFSDFAPSTVYFRGNRDRGAMLFGVEHGLEWYAGYFDGSGIATHVNDNAQGLAVGRLAYNVYGKSVYDEVPQLNVGGDALHLAFGVSGMHNDKEITTTAPTTGLVQKLGSVPVDTLGADAVLTYGPVMVQAEAYYQGSRNAPSAATKRVHRVGGYAMAGLFVWPETLQLGARADVVKLDVDAGPTTRQVAGMIAWYLRGQHVKVQARYAYQSATAATPNPTTLPPGTTHDVQLAMQLLF